MALTLPPLHLPGAWIGTSFFTETKNGLSHLLKIGRTEHKDHLSKQYVLKDTQYEMFIHRIAEQIIFLTSRGIIDSQHAFKIILSEVLLIISL